MKTQHTKGNWGLRYNPSGSISEIVIDEKTVCSFDCSEFHFTDKEKHAELIAVAPELLKTCKQLADIAAGRYHKEKSLNLKAEWKPVIDNAFNLIKTLTP